MSATISGAKRWLWQSIFGGAFDSAANPCGCGSAARLVARNFRRLIFMGGSVFERLAAGVRRPPDDDQAERIDKTGNDAHPCVVAAGPAHEGAGAEHARGGGE